MITSTGGIAEEDGYERNILQESGGKLRQSP